MESLANKLAYNLHANETIACELRARYLQLAPDSLQLSYKLGSVQGGCMQAREEAETTEKSLRQLAYNLHESEARHLAHCMEMNEKNHEARLDLPYSSTADCWS